MNKTELLSFNVFGLNMVDRYGLSTTIKIELHRQAEMYDEQVSQELLTALENGMPMTYFAQKRNGHWAIHQTAKQFANDIRKGCFPELSKYSYKKMVMQILLHHNSFDIIGDVDRQDKELKRRCESNYYDSSCPVVYEFLGNINGISMYLKVRVWPNTAQYKTRLDADLHVAKYTIHK